MIREEITQRTIEYLNDTDFKGEKPSLMIVDFVIQKFKEHRHYPSSFSEEKVEKDMEKYIPIMAMAVVDLMCKEGAEGEISHSENGVNREYENAYISKSIFSNILPYVGIL